MNKKRPYKGLEINKEYYKPKAYTKRKKDYNKLIDKRIEKEEKKMNRLLKKLESKGYTKEFLRNHILTEIHIKANLI